MIGQAWLDKTDLWNKGVSKRPHQPKAGSAREGEKGLGYSGAGGGKILAATTIPNE